ncbi:MAG: hypothetical protein A3C93_04910 [Candidatus Lloydbacteria bacterium RIFCSPHIGHO2_02_FULL_54_17]|uniref:N-acetyltransferase domain-containing protein n=1 Tax=Candidatus Lloydbacteria bacterium RIFCSPHIGHO2_02_FULL_54_17 TaxID=1798664 RepID=A0A1G2DIV3_9BACT|nr:MAG: hypothetical protein A2762_04100 [Candidatus Lloydbacteria bacterium RIFCSPHIGHO2_01_FULL_54_11]OGZ13585.1 MAG: hypothetical protein A3C93_04910 [Candidatus Lloydbacteria bacterium RIFCSPHIGHO2_02_FULL_54_17]OGZ15423.1 MAG: hypothetical protein A2948_06070 [Candidatus Lloydbacteria bacterium RIFCSPLOWO2_01_FULL_54_18]OGZ16260.1 MAG: hypothetical protein A3H76_01280 [Candidatus Lloydbacteria bacterium RIFCSPLOWO2_02_FULL_54_12]
MLSTRLVTRRLVLRPLLLRDAKDVQALAGDIRVADTTLLIPHPYADGLAEQWIKRTRRTFKKGDSFAFAILARTDDGEAEESFIGCMSLAIDKTHNAAELGYWIGYPYWNQGFATEAGRAVIRFGLEVLGLERIAATHLSRNPASGCVMKKIGMMHVGRLRRSIQKNGVFEDRELYEIIRSDYLGFNVP